MTNKLEFLRQLPIFARLDDNELEALNRISHEYQFNEGAVIGYQRDVADSLYIVRNGRLYARVIDNQGRVRESDFTRGYESGKWFGESWLFTPGTHPATVKATEPGKLIIINNADFLEFLTQHQAALDKLEPELDEQGLAVTGLSQEAWDEAQKISFKKGDRGTSDFTLLPDELVEYYSRRSVIYLLEKLFGPFFVSILVLVAYLIIPTEAPGWQILKIGLTVVAGLFIFVWFLFVFLDWRNDYFVITNKHITHREFELRGFSTRLIKVPIEQVQSVTVDKPTLLSNLFNIGTTRVTTAAQAGTILFDNIDDPLEVKDTLNRLRGRVQELDAGLAQTAMRRSLQGHFQLPPAYEPLEGEEPEAAPQTSRRRRQSFSEWRRGRFGWRVEEGGVITYRKHIFVLLGSLLLPISLLLLLIAVGVVVLVFAGMEWFFWVALPSTILGLSDVAWIVWRVEDWRNDTFQVTNRFVIDIDRRPFGFGESRKQASLSNIQNVSAERPGFLPTLLDYGFVLVETAGATADIEFENVPHPSRIQADIFRRLDEFRQQQRVRDGASRREEYAVLVDVYRQIMEQSPIPRRTPTEDGTPGGTGDAGDAAAASAD